MTTSKRVASDAARTLRNPKSTKIEKEEAGAALAARKSNTTKRKSKSKKK